MLLTQNFKNKIVISIIFFIIYYIIFGLTSFLSGLIQERITVAFPFEYNIPFRPAWAIIYLSISLFLSSAFFILRSWQLFAGFAITLLIETIIAGAFFIILPMKLIYLPDSYHGVFTTIVYIAKMFSLNHNYFPSLHTAFAFTAACIYRQYCSTLVSIFFFLWALAIPLATLFIHEHQLVDLIAGFFLALASYHYIFPRTINWVTSILSRYIRSFTINKYANKISNH